MGIASALFSQTQQRVLSLLFGQPDRAFGTVELIRLAGSGSGAVQREVARLVAAGLVTSMSAGRQKSYRANHASPIFAELRGIVQKTAGVPEILREALGELSGVSFAVLYGSVAKGSDKTTSDIDVLVVSDSLALEELYLGLEPAERRLGRRVSPTLYTSSEYRKRRREKHAFLTKVLSGAHEVLVGNEDGIRASR